jgi:hypothetical protein
MRLSEAAGATISIEARPGYPPRSGPITGLRPDPDRRAVEAAASDGPVEDLLESCPRGLGHLPTGLPQALGNRPAISTAARKTLHRPPPAFPAATTAPTAAGVSTRYTPAEPERRTHRPAKRPLEPRRAPASLRSDQRSESDRNEWSDSIGTDGRIRRNRQSGRRTARPDRLLRAERLRA